jgi:hypothetical protein
MVETADISNSSSEQAKIDGQRLGWDDQEIAQLARDYEEHRRNKVETDKKKLNNLADACHLKSCAGCWSVAVCISREARHRLAGKK